MQKLAIAVLMGTIVGAVAYLTIESKAVSYLSTDSRTCANCHVMLSAYNSWHASSHREHTNCADCHIPQDNVISKYAAKAMDGARHAAVFTLDTYEEVIHATESARSTIQRNCIRCHGALLDQTPTHSADLLSDNSNEKTCWSCHRYTPHGKGNSVSSFQGISTDKADIRIYKGDTHE